MKSFRCIFSVLLLLSLLLSACHAPSVRPATASTETAEVQAASFTAHNADGTAAEALAYWLYIPSDPTDEMPLIVYLHGGSEKGSDLELITAADGFPKYLQEGALGDLRAYVLIPQLPAAEKSWDAVFPALHRLILETVSAYSIDESRLSLTGHSMGGTGVWSFACAYPTLFSRIAPLSGSVRVTQARLNALQPIRVWAFVGSADTIVPPRASEVMVAALQNAGGDARITVLDGADHFSVPALVYLSEDDRLTDWLIGT